MKKLTLLFLALLLTACAGKPIHVLDTENQSEERLSVVKFEKKKMVLLAIDNVANHVETAGSVFLPTGQYNLLFRVNWLESKNDGSVHRKGHGSLHWICLSVEGGKYSISVEQPFSEVMFFVNSHRTDHPFTMGKCNGDE